MKRPYIERPVLTYRNIVAIREIANEYDYPKNTEGMIWGIPHKYDNPLDREISALCCSWIYDGTKHSLDAALEMDSWFKGSPSEFIIGKKFTFWIMQQEQDLQVYNAVTIRHCYYLFAWMKDFYSKFKSICAMIDTESDLIPYEQMQKIIGGIDAFNGKSTNSTGRINLFLFMMVHCFDQINLDASQLRPPLFEHNILPSCRALGILTKKDKKKVWVERVYEHLLWFSEENPMTYWVGIAAYNRYLKERPIRSKKFASMKLKRYKYRKK